VTTGRHRVSATVRQAVHEVRQRAGTIEVRLAAGGDAAGDRPA
jgi:hypothetical protein